MNPWLKIPLEDYEAHMSLNSIAQAQYLSQLLYENVTETNAKSVAIIGCSGGNGMDKLQQTQVSRVVGIDINPFYIQNVYARHSHRFQDLDLLCMDFVHPTEVFASVDFISAALVFEYVDYKLGLKSLLKFLKHGGSLSVVLQLPSENISEVSPSPYKSLNLLNSVFKFIEPTEFLENALINKLTLTRNKRTKLNSGKDFHEFIFKKL